MSEASKVRGEGASPNPSTAIRNGHSRSSITTLTGTNQYLISEKLAQEIASFKAAYGDMAVEKIDGEEAEYERLVEALTQLPFLAKEMLIILRNPSKNPKFKEKIEQIIDSIPETNSVIIIETKPDKRLAYFKVLKAKTNLFELNQLDERELVNWLINKASNLGGKLLQSDADYLIDKVGPNQQMLSNEIEKLINYGPNISRQTIDLLVEPTPKSTIFNLLNAVFSKDRAKAARIYDEQREQKVEPLEILAMLGWQLRILALIKTARGRSQNDIARDAKLNPFVVRKSADIAAKITLTDLKKTLAEAVELDTRLKSENIDADDALKLFLLSLSG